MPVDPDAYRHHPGLARLIIDPETSGFRTFQPADFDARMKAMGRPADWRRSQAEREATRQAALESRRGRDIWVFAYGSLMWDPALMFSEVRRCGVEGYSRRMALYDEHGPRGSKDAPGVMAALAPGARCDGVAFRIEADLVERETEILWRREMIAPAYIPVFLPAETAQGTIDVLAFAADLNAEVIRMDLSHEDQVACVAFGEGALGTSYDYLKNMLDHFAELGIEDQGLEALMCDVDQARMAKAAIDRS